ncbi:hypothetical protein [Wolbachia endosymbiont (group A) of Anthophora plumipes]|uniref:hypothetical protein n=1 Tax=Wolbachia endosymbiont (group A) of Anthophora plumipes TaxID=3066194 RepID=UPI0033411BD7
MTNCRHLSICPWIPASRAGMTPVFIFAINPYSLMSYQHLFFLSSQCPDTGFLQFIKNTPF